MWVAWTITGHFLLCSSYIKRYWKKPLFDLLDKLRVTLDHVYGEGKVSLIDASLRWMYHHSKMEGAQGGKVNFLSVASFKWQREVMFPEFESYLFTHRLKLLTYSG